MEFTIISLLKCPFWAGERWERRVSVVSLQCCSCSCDRQGHGCGMLINWTLTSFYLCSSVLIPQCWKRETFKKCFWQWWWNVPWRHFEWVPFSCLYSSNAVVLIWLFFISKACVALARNPLLGSFLAYFSSNGCHQDALFCHCELFLFPTVNCFGFHLWQITFHIYKRSFFWYFIERLLFISNIDFGKCEVIILNKKEFFPPLPFSVRNATASSRFERRNFFSCIRDQHIRLGIVLDEQKDQRTLLARSKKST